MSPDTQELTLSTLSAPSPLAGFERIKAMVLDSVTSLHSRRAYDRALTDFLLWYRAIGAIELNKATILQYRAKLAEMGLAASSQNVRLTAIRRLAAEAADNGLLAPELAAGIGRIKGVKRQGVRTGTWLTLEQAERLINAPSRRTRIGLRDRALLAVLIGCGLRRSEISDLRLDQIQQRDGRWVLLDLVGKGGRVRTVPAPSWAKEAIDRWIAVSKISEGRVFRSMNRHNSITADPFLPQNILETVSRYGKIIGLPKLAPHDLRRTFAKLAHKGRAALEQIQISLGHASIQTTERYLWVRQDLTDAPCDRLGINPILPVSE